MRSTVLAHRTIELPAGSVQAAIDQIADAVLSRGRAADPLVATVGHQPGRAGRPAVPGRHPVPVPGLGERSGRPADPGTDRAADRHRERRACTHRGRTLVRRGRRGNQLRPGHHRYRHRVRCRDRRPSGRRAHRRRRPDRPPTGHRVRTAVRTRAPRLRPLLPVVVGDGHPGGNGPAAARPDLRRTAVPGRAGRQGRLPGGPRRRLRTGHPRRPDHRDHRDPAR